VPTPDHDTYFVAHSLGGITVLRYLESLKPDVRIGGFVLVAGFNDRLAVHPQLDAFHRPALDCAKLERMAAHRLVIAARDDPAVPHAVSERLAAALKAGCISLDKGGHFLDSDGFVEFPLLLGQLRGWFQTRA
jgi:predicted alpha/beta hydrolase family esterase